MTPREPEQQPPAPADAAELVALRAALLDTAAWLEDTAEGLAVVGRQINGKNSTRGVAEMVRSCVVIESHRMKARAKKLRELADAAAAPARPVDGPTDPGRPQLETTEGRAAAAARMRDQAYTPTVEEALADPEGFVDGMTEVGDGKPSMKGGAK